MKKILLALTLIFSLSASATHIVGGEITWENLPNGQYQFNLVLVRDCTGANLVSQTESLTTNSGVSITCTRVSTETIYSQCGSSPCATPAPGTMGVYEKHTYQSGPITLTGTPPPSGWNFEWSLCCRPNSVNITGAPSVSLKSTIYPYQINGSGTTQLAKDNSPRFLPQVQSLFCTIDTNMYQVQAVDVDGDSISYALAPAFSGSNSFVAYNTGYTGANPLPTNGQNFMVLDSLNGGLKFYSTTSGLFLVNVRADAYRNGQKISSTYRDFVIAIINCTPSTGVCSTMPSAPTEIQVSGITPSDSLVEDLTVKSKGLFASYTRLAEANLGDTVQFEMTAIDMDLLPNCMQQSITVEGHETRFSSLATLVSQNPNGSLTASGLNSVLVSFPITCDVLSAESEVFYFDFIADDCPIKSTLRVKIKIPLNNNLAKTLTFDQNLSGIQSNGDIDLVWYKPDSLNGFTHYTVWNKLNAGGLQLLDTIFNYTDTFYVHQSPGVGSNQYWVQSIGKCPSTTDSLAILNDSANTITFKNSIGIAEEVLNVRAYPQPMNQSVTFDGFATGENVEVQVFDVSGRLLQQESQAPLAGKMEINTAQLSSGIYVFVLSWADYSTQIKLIKHE